MRKYDQLLRNLKEEPLVTFLAIEFFTCSFYDKSKPLYDDIFNIFDKKYKNVKNGGNSLFWIHGGRFSIEDFMYYGQTKNVLGNNSFPMGVGESVVEKLLKVSALIEITPLMNSVGKTLYIPNIEYVKFLKDNKLLENILFGFLFVIDKYKSSVALIQIHNKNGDISVGSGFLISYKDISFIVTNQHVVVGASKVEVFLNDQILINNNIVESENADIAFIQLQEKIEYPDFFLNNEIEILSDIITIGYPTIPMTKDAYQIYHKGEINSFVQDYKGNDLFLISAKTSSGNSGSPVIDNHGSVVGIITEELFQEDLFKEKGKLPYYAAIPSSTIISELKSLM